ncbi:uncharacterized protein LOC115622785 [Scaptodrosophila lebanonensis]|uniref:Coiled-coil domain-containing protein 181 n=1 Tax=Drosophila lebanonensis TaxID=7225 RepID=A0A6J2TBF3_DROLE|nr:uncharacterized protein LOC115622785 [Scaptodrosophila lebanonensis]
MYEHEAESDEDCEVYFLKPVNEYNIVDKIKEANKELFDNEGPPPNAASGTMSDSANGRKVTFAPNLEDYEPSPCEQNKSNSDSTEEEDDSSILLVQELTRLTLRSEHFAPIAEEEAPALKSLESEFIEDNKVTEPEAETEPQHLQETEQDPKEPEEEEISEEILDVVDMESPITIPNQKPSQQPEESEFIKDNDYDDDDFSGVDENDLFDSEQRNEAAPTTINQRHLDRQITFDHDGESDNKSLTNLLTESDCEEDERAINEARLRLRQAYKSLYQTLGAEEQAKIDELTGPTKTNLQSNGADDEDDDLSIIVASYIPDNFELNERSIYYKKDEDLDEQPNGKPSSNKSRGLQRSEQSTKNFFTTRRFSFRRKAKPRPTEHVPDIKLNYKTCCEHRHSLQEKLPRYTGYLSEYGLSAQQLDRRDQQLRRKQHFALEQTLSRSEQELKKMQDNERAFTTWLKNKMRYPINKTRNMFDAKMRRGSVAALTTLAPSSASHRQQQHQSNKHLQQPRLGRRDSNEVHAYRHLLGHWNK